MSWGVIVWITTMIQAVTAALLNSQPDTTINENSLSQTTNVKRLMWPFPVAMNNKVFTHNQNWLQGYNTLNVMGAVMAPGDGLKAQSWFYNFRRVYNHIQLWHSTTFFYFIFNSVNFCRNIALFLLSPLYVYGLDSISCCFANLPFIHCHINSFHTNRFKNIKWPVWDIYHWFKPICKSQRWGEVKLIRTFIWTFYKN